MEEAIQKKRTRIRRIQRLKQLVRDRLSHVMDVSIGDDHPSAVFTTVGQFSMRNKRQQNEDVTYISMHKIAIFDGHGGADVARDLCGIMENGNVTAYDINQLFIDYEIGELDDDMMFSTTIGSTAAVICLYGPAVQILSIGDSLCIIKKGQQLVTNSRSNCYNNRELTRLQTQFGSGSCVQNGKIDYNLSVTAAVGDLSYKNYGVTSKGEIINVVHDNTMRYCLVASDGLLERLTVEQIDNLVEFLLSGHWKDAFDIEEGLQSPTSMNYNELNALASQQAHKDLSIEQLQRFASLVANNMHAGVQRFLFENGLLNARPTEITVDNKNRASTIAQTLVAVSHYLGCSDNCSCCVGLFE